MAHGRYVFKGKDEPMEVLEVGAVGTAPLTPPADADKARRAVSVEEEQTLGWRPAQGLDIPRRSGWLLGEKIGEGGFGEVWLAQNQRTKERRVFKFCFDTDRLRHFKRELTLFRLLREALGDRDDIAQLLEVQLEQPPFYLESHYVEGGNLAQWAEREGGIDRLPLSDRLELLSKIARAVGAAHSVGIIHKDIKPSNVFIEEGEDDRPQPKLADFGIGVVTDRALLDQHAITATGLTEGLLDNQSSRTGTRLYQPPEAVLGKPATTQEDAYALGVMLYQFVCGDLSRPLATGWESDVEDELLLEDIRVCTHGDVSQRLASADELVERLETLEERRAAQANLARATRRARQLKMLAWITAASLLLCTIVGGLGLLSYQQWQKADVARTAAVREKERAEQLFYTSQIRNAQHEWEGSDAAVAAVGG